MFKPRTGSVEQGPGRKPIRTVLLVILVVALVCTVGLVFSSPYLAAPDKELPPPDLLQQNILTQNLVTKAKASFISMLLSGSGRLTMDFSSSELNALLYPALEQRLRGSAFSPLGSAVSVTKAQKLSIDLALKWQDRPLGIRLVTIPQSTPDGKTVFLIEQFKLGKISLPPGLVVRLAKPYLPAGVLLEGSPLRLTVDPDALLSKGLPPSLKGFRLYIDGLTLADNRLRLGARLLLRSGNP